MTNSIEAFQANLGCRRCGNEIAHTAAGWIHPDSGIQLCPVQPARSGPARQAEPYAVGEVTLRVAYNPDVGQVPPAEWDWPEMLDVGRNHVEVLPDPLVQVGWAGPKKPGPDPDQRELTDGEGPRPGEVEYVDGDTSRWSIDPGEWYLRPEGDEDDLVDPWPVYGRRGDMEAHGVTP